MRRWKLWRRGGGEWRVAVLYGAVAAAHADARTRTRVLVRYALSRPLSLSRVL